MYFRRRKELDSLRLSFFFTRPQEVLSLVYCCVSPVDLGRSKWGSAALIIFKPQKYHFPWSSGTCSLDSSTYRWEGYMRTFAVMACIFLSFNFTVLSESINQSQCFNQNVRSTTQIVKYRLVTVGYFASYSITETVWATFTFLLWKEIPFGENNYIASHSSFTSLCNLFRCSSAEGIINKLTDVLPLPKCVIGKWNCFGVTQMLLLACDFTSVKDTCGGSGPPFIDLLCDYVSKRIWKIFRNNPCSYFQTLR